MHELSQRERDVLTDLQSAARKSMRSKPTLRILSSLSAKGMIEYDPFAGTAKLTPLGEQNLS